MNTEPHVAPNGPLYPQTKEEWIALAHRYWSLVSELGHELEAGRIAVAPGTAFTARQSVQALFKAVREAAASPPFHPYPDDIPPENTPRGAA